MQGTTMRRPSIFGGVTAIAGISALVLGLAIVDDRVRVQLARVLSGKPPTDEIASVGNSFTQLMSVTWQAVADQSIENAPLVVFSVAALALVIWMTRT
jgi:hypothetical protein